MIKGLVGGGRQKERVFQATNVGYHYSRGHYQWVSGGSENNSAGAPTRQKHLIWPQKREGRLAVNKETEGE